MWVNKGSCMEENTPKPLTKDQVGMLKMTFKSIDAFELGKRFYAKLFERHPQLRQLFTSDMNEQITKIMSVLQLVVFSFEEKQDGNFYLQDEVVKPLRDLGSKHTQRGVQQFHYPIANQILLEAVKDEARDLLTSEGLEAWKLALDHLSFAMNNTAVKTPAQSQHTLRDSFTYIKNLLKIS